MSVSPEQIQASVRQFIESELLRNREDTKLDAADNLFTSGTVDSMGIMRLIMFLEKKYGIHVPAVDQTPDNFRTLEVIGTYVAGLLEP